MQEKFTGDNPELALLEAGDRQLGIHLRIRIFNEITTIVIVFIITIVIKLSTFPALVSMCANVVRPGLGTLPATTRSRKAEESGPLSSNLAEIHINKLLMVGVG